jgi:hypothetical protein
MTYDEVCVTVGGPPGDYAAPDEWHPPWPMWGAGWHSGDGHLRVHFDRDGRADWVSVARLGPPSVWSRLRGWLGL